MSTANFEVLNDSYRFMRRNRHIIERSPDQAYISAFLFTSKTSYIRKKILGYDSNMDLGNDTRKRYLESVFGHFVGPLSGSQTHRFLFRWEPPCLRIK